jgi:D-3-phosphoglycerate dehydrogenase
MPQNLSQKMGHSLQESFEVIVADRFDTDAFVRLSKAVNAFRSSAPDLIATDLTNVDALLIRSRTKITRDLLKRAPRLKIIVTSTSGFDHIDLAACTEHKVKVMFTPTANAASACELTWGLALMAARKLSRANEMISVGDWNREPLMGSQMSGKTYGVIGLGRIGSRVAAVAHAFGMKVIAYDPYKEPDQFRSANATRVSLNELFKLADVVSIHVPATDETENMVSREVLENGQHGLLFVNTSRGSVIPESLLAEALDQRWIGACGLDVFEREPLPRDSKLLGRSNVVLSPHVGATTFEAFKAASEEAADKMIAFAQHGAVSDELPGNEPWMAGRI